MRKAEAAQARLGHAEGLLWSGISSGTVSLILSLTQQILIKPLLCWRPGPEPAVDRQPGSHCVCAQDLMGTAPDLALGARGRESQESFL